ncbi:MAG TPA: 1,4-alpha-glucan branching protein GlgB [Candidatus Merdenecus merdavium]|nr:1,4-alpha-glucan branching protein GlgB [Candidatus Merdenecus merdavium]
MKVGEDDLLEQGGVTNAITEFDQYLFGQGTHYEIYRKLGAHIAYHGKVKGVRFAVWAPHGERVHVVGNFNQWNIQSHEMNLLGDGGIFELFIPGIDINEVYKFYITTKDGRGLYKADPYANYAELRPNTASIVTNIEGFPWEDSQWMKKRVSTDINSSPISVYELHLGSWKRHKGTKENPDGFYHYRELAHELTDYVKKMGFTHVELMGLLEYPYDGSWGYQVTGYYAPTSRYGSPTDFMYFVNYLHQNNIGIILDWVPAHFPKDEHGLTDFDGSPLYEYEDPRKGEHVEWGTKVFDYGKNEVRNFLIGSALLWIEHYHIDGLRVDAVASMLYLDYGRNPGEWVPNQYGENKNLEAVDFFKHLNTLVLGRNKGAMMIAEESTTWPKVTGKVEDGGLGFTMKWNMGWMNDFLEYQMLDPYFRRFNHNKMTFSMTYAYSENYMLVLSHDEVVHLKKSMLEKMPGVGEKDKIENLKVAYTFMIGHPGKKLLFMGQEFGQIREWSEERQLDWHVRKSKKHKELQEFVKSLFMLYQGEPSLYETDAVEGGFEWIDADDADRSIFSFIRYSKNKKEQLIFICNFTPVDRLDYQVGVPKKGEYEVLLESHISKKKIYRTEEGNQNGREQQISYQLKGYGAVVLKYLGDRIQVAKAAKEQLKIEIESNKKVI